ncbi:hypothetical protein CK203_085705 [Vitis vinifera]|uniref:Uncharacterized protein n=1 Tax=Vitis vinifera TaxID=29760 RepID=A0A438BLP3_VITVI|nr:hypothetical protein CK203_085705 [Vitis vinifera]
MLAWQGRLWTDALKHMAYSLTCMHQIIRRALGARKAYQSLYGESIEEDVASRVEGIER